MQILIALTCAFIFIAAGLYYLSISLVMREPYEKHATKLLRKAENVFNVKDPWLIPPLSTILNLAASIVYLSPSDYRDLENKLLRLSLPYTPQQYVARGYLGIAIGVLAVAACAVCKVLILAPLGILLGAWLFLRNKDLINDQIERKNSLIRMELPQFVRSIEASVGGDRDLIRIIRRYMKVSGEGLRRDLDILLIDMNTGNVQTSLRKFESRVGLPEVSRLVNILISMEMGTDQSAALTLLASNLTQYTREARKREIALRPGKMKRTLLPAVFILILAIMYVFIYNLLSTSSVMF